MVEDSGILCIGEVLWDSLPAGLFLGGAPLNVCFHLNQLGANATICSRVGNDRLGKDALDRIAQKGITTEYIQRDEEIETGFVKVSITENGDPSYEIMNPAAWDEIKVTAGMKTLVEKSWGLVFGTLAQRNKTSRNTIQRLWELDTRMILDLNLREPYINREIVADSLRAADIIKMNEDELRKLGKWYDLDGREQQKVEELADRFGASLFCITRGSMGALLFHEGSWYEHKGYPAASVDSVGAGDAFLAALIYGLQNECRGVELLKFANAAGSFVAQRNGATPAYGAAELKAIITPVA